MLESQAYSCPYCGEPAEALLDLSAGDQQYYEDCLVVPADPVRPAHRWAGLVTERPPGG